MHFEGVFVVAAPMGTVFEAVTDPDKVARCIPDLRRLDVRQGGEFDAVVGVSIVRGELTLHFRTVEKEAPSRVKMVAHGDGLGSAIDVAMVTELADAQGGTSMKWTAEAMVGGRLASLGQGMLKSQTERIVRQLFDCLRSRLEQGP